jgi:hypothetical protein
MVSASAAALHVLAADANSRHMENFSEHKGPMCGVTGGKKCQRKFAQPCQYGKGVCCAKVILMT